jgi:hypothetical protein
MRFGQRPSAKKYQLTDKEREKREKMATKVLAQWGGFGNAANAGAKSTASLDTPQPTAVDQTELMTIANQLQSVVARLQSSAPTGGATPGSPKKAATTAPWAQKSKGWGKAAKAARGELSATRVDTDTDTGVAGRGRTPNRDR